MTSFKISHVPIIIGDSYLLLKFVEDCEKFGYKGINKSQCDAKCMTLNGNAWERILESPSAFKELWLHTDSSDYSALKGKLDTITFDISVQYVEALRFMEENMLKWEGKIIQNQTYDIF